MIDQLRYQGTADQAYYQLRGFQKRLKKHLGNKPSEYFMENDTELGSLYAVESMLQKEALLRLKVEGGN